MPNSEPGQSGWGYADFHTGVNFRFTEFSWKFDDTPAGLRGARSSRAWGFEKFDGVASGVVEQDLLAAEPTHDVVAEVCPRVAKGFD